MEKIPELKTSDKLLRALKEASSRKQTTDEIRDQRVSFIFGSIDKSSGVTRSRIKEVLAEQEGVKA